MTRLRMTNIQCTNQVCRIEMTTLIRLGLFKHKDSKVSTKLKWTNGSTINIQCFNSDEGIYLEIEYAVTEYNAPKQINYHYRIDIEQLPSNLGKGKTLYFRCPISHKRCRILYLAYNSHVFKAREAYQNRIYYELQKTSKQDYAIIHVNVLKRKIEKIKNQQKRNQDTYKGRVTKKAIYIQRLEIQQLKSQEKSIAAIYKALGMSQELAKQKRYV